MKKKPLLFTILALAHFLEPIIKIISFKITTTFSFTTIFENIAQIEAPREIFDFWFLFPLGGLALISVKKWSYPIFVGVQAYSIYAHLTYEKYTWPYVSDIPFVSSLVLLFLNALIIVYFALPDVRRPFFDQSVRWWETRKRFGLRIPMSFTLISHSRSHNCDILNISQSGVFLSGHQEIQVGSEIKMNILYKDFAISINGKVRSHHCYLKQPGIGVQFVFGNILENLYMRKVVRQISKDLNSKNTDNNIQNNEQVPKSYKKSA